MKKLLLSIIALSATVAVHAKPIQMNVKPNGIVTEQAPLQSCVGCAPQSTYYYSYSVDPKNTKYVTFYPVGGSQSTGNFGRNIPASYIRNGRTVSVPVTIGQPTQTNGPIQRSTTTPQKRSGYIRNGRFVPITEPIGQPTQINRPMPGRATTFQGIKLNNAPKGRKITIYQTQMNFAQRLSPKGNGNQPKKIPYITVTVVK